MLSFVALTSIVALASANTLKPGSAIEVSLDENSPQCPITVDITSEQADAECFIQFHAPCVACGTLSYTFNKDTLGTDALAYLDTDTADESGEVVEAPCPSAGTYLLGTQIKTCAACIGDKNLNVEVSATVRKGNQYKVAIENSSRSSKIFMKQEQSTEFTYSATAGSVAHFNIDKCGVACSTDDYEYQAGPVGGELVDVSSENGNLVKISHDADGEFRLVVTLAKAIAGDTTWFYAKFKLNEDPGSLDFPVPEALCAEADCTLARLANCDDCLDDSCGWCATEKKCKQPHLTCANDEQIVLDDDQCASASSIAMSAVALVATAFVTLF